MARDIIVIGGSAGALPALETLFRELPSSTPASVFVVLHLSAHPNKNLPRLLSPRARYARDEERFQHGSIYLAPPNQHLRLNNGTMELDTGPTENRHRPAIDALFRSAAWQYGPRVIGVVLGGALDDGTAGLWQIKRRRGVAVVQAPEDALFPSMPLSAIRQVHVDYIVPVKDMATLLFSLCTGNAITPSTAKSPLEESEL